jgi:hypothetical protein
MTLPRADAVIFDHGPRHIASLAAFTALSASAFDPRGIFAHGSPR